MKHLSTLALAAALSLVSCSSHQGGWSLVWTEDFEGPALDEASWSRVDRGTSDWDNMMSLRPDLAYIEDGQLVLLGKANDGSSEDTTKFVTGGVTGKGKKSFKLARFEIKARFSCANGFWPALWLMPDCDVAWPDAGEIDIMEHLNGDPFVYQTVHSDYSLNVDDQDPPHSVTAPIRKDDWNIYAVEVYQDSVCFYTNGAKTLTYPRVEGKAHQFPWADFPFYLILSNQLEGAWVGKVDKPEQLPSELRIDWIKVYEWKD